MDWTIKLRHESTGICFTAHQAELLKWVAFLLLRRCCASGGRHTGEARPRSLVLRCGHAPNCGASPQYPLPTSDHGFSVWKHAILERENECTPGALLSTVLNTVPFQSFSGVIRWYEWRLVPRNASEQTLLT